MEGHLTGKARLIGAAAAAAILAASSASATSLTLGGGWQVFQWFDGVGSSIGEYTFTITTPAPELFQIADGYDAGDEFAISINGGALIPTSVSEYNPAVYNPLYYIGDNWSAAFYPDEAPFFSHLSLILPAGSYDITGMVTQNSQFVFGDCSACGAGAVQLTFVPEPSDWTLMLLGFGVLGGVLRHRARAVAAKA
jgi:hypothetical protein